MLELKHISYSVQEPEGTLDILKDISLCIDEHRLVVFTGPNGGGKTTLAKGIMRLIPNPPGSSPPRPARSSGTVRTLPT